MSEESDITLPATEQAPDPVNPLTEFARQILRDKELARRNRPPVQSGPKVFSTFVASHPARPIKKPEGRKVTQVPAGKASGLSISAGAFYTLYVNGDGDTMLQGGTVTGGNGGSETIADYEVIVTGATLPLASSGNVLYLKATCTATVEDGIMLPGCELTAATLTTTLADNHSFTVAAPSGDIYTEIGRWTDDTFLPSYPGNVVASGCLGNFLLTRG